MTEENLRQPLLSNRIPVRREAILRFPHLPGIVSAVCRDISMTGMYVQSRGLAIPGTAVTFAVAPDGGDTIRGHAEVIWMRDKDDGPRRPRGMGLRFVRLSEENRLRIRQAVEDRLFRGGTPSDLAELMSVSADSVHQTLAAQIATEPETGADPGADASASGVDPKKLHPYAGVAAARPQPLWRRHGWTALAGALFTGLLIAGFAYLL